MHCFCQVFLSSAPQLALANEHILAMSGIHILVSPKWLSLAISDDHTLALSSGKQTEKYAAFGIFPAPADFKTLFKTGTPGHVFKKGRL